MAIDVHGDVLIGGREPGHGGLDGLGGGDDGVRGGEDAGVALFQGLHHGVQDVANGNAVGVLQTDAEPVSQRLLHRQQEGVVDLLHITHTRHWKLCAVPKNTNHRETFDITNFQFRRYLGGFITKKMIT